jgi:hypothetical protein
MVEPQKQVAERGKLTDYGPTALSILVPDNEAEEHRHEGSEINRDEAPGPYQSGLVKKCPGRVAGPKEDRLDSSVQRNTDTELQPIRTWSIMRYPAGAGKAWPPPKRGVSSFAM